MCHPCLSLPALQPQKGPIQPVPRPKEVRSKTALQEAVDVRVLVRGRGMPGLGQGTLGGRPLYRLPLLLLMVLLAAPAGAWYKHMASPRYRTVGRAAGLLLGLGRSPYRWRRSWDTLTPGALGLGVSLQEPSVREAVVQLPSGVQKLREAARGSSQAELPVRAPGSPRTPKPEPRQDTHSWALAAPSRYMRERAFEEIPPAHHTLSPAQAAGPSPSLAVEGLAEGCKLKAQREAPYSLRLPKEHLGGGCGAWALEGSKGVVRTRLSLLLTLPLPLPLPHGELAWLALPGPQEPATTPLLGRRGIEARVGVGGGPALGTSGPRAEGRGRGGSGGGAAARAQAEARGDGSRTESPPRTPVPADTSSAPPPAPRMVGDVR
ncbi:PREDICTED: uncharacterized protein LOC102842441 [Chrysochloris asiatica]|uniref:Uncharacterized protein LOC102842441 n=1 Tax=Chrysochloris asiatica TaxID=185453 RepID=A0A9B0U169_CHRAS|nr:PREDICTED: uncharacterized protein LOC102842441 [Chrysochloris asiatica]